MIYAQKTKQHNTETRGESKDTEGTKTSSRHISSIGNGCVGDNGKPIPRPWREEYTRATHHNTREN